MDSIEELPKRIIKFRAWDPHNDEMFLSDDNKRCAFYFDSVMKCAELIENDEDSAVGFYTNEIEDAVVMQFTGLLDKNGKEIYEGDIIKVTGPWEADDGENEKVIAVKWHSCGGYVIEWSSGFCGGDADLTTFGWAKDEGYEFEVIGNIYQNPDLL